MCRKTFSVLLVTGIIAFANLSAAESSETSASDSSQVLLGTTSELSDASSESNEAPYQMTSADPETIPELISKAGSVRQVRLPKYGMAQKRTRVPHLSTPSHRIMRRSIRRSIRRPVKKPPRIHTPQTRPQQTNTLLKGKPQLPRERSEPMRRPKKGQLFDRMPYIGQPTFLEQSVPFSDQTTSSDEEESES